jgi:hypothetical protein
VVDKDVIVLVFDKDVIVLVFDKVDFCFLFIDA